MIEIEDIKRLDVKPGDTLVIKVADARSAAELNAFSKVIAGKLPAGVEILIAGGDVEFSVIRRESAVTDG